MKKTFFLILAVLWTQFPLFSQNRSLEKIFDEYSTRDNFTVVSIGESMISSLDMFADVNDNLKELSSGIKFLKILAFMDEDDSGDAAPQRNLQKNNLDSELKKILKKENFEILLQAKDGDENVGIYQKPFKKKESDCILLVSEESEYVVIWLFGEINAKKLARAFSN